MNAIPNNGMLVEVNYYPDPVWQDECVTFIFTRNEGPLQFVGAFFDLLRDDASGYRVRVPCALDQLPSEALSDAMTFALSVCNRIDDEPDTQRDPSKWGTS